MRSTPISGVMTLWTLPCPTDASRTHSSTNGHANRYSRLDPFSTGRCHCKGVLNLLDDVTCQLFHRKWAIIVSYSWHGAWACSKRACASQARQDRRVADLRHNLAPTLTPSSDTSNDITKRAA